MKLRIATGSVAALLLAVAALGWHHGHAAAAQARPTTAPASKVHYVASSARSAFHRPDCKWALKISPKNLQVFETREEAIAAGHRPCKECQP